ncbi:peptidoglycan-associated lipoprotein Pal [Pseudoalteromonas phenolica]|uniref:Peptidoglycan-associated lipoprotein n=1 Tax=Pseudoalteromonas phenolica TaxID=161398 RepID=A0A0S2K2C8_9GAMM|nr:peptidoglycan-associated lipoprotein Pal [Pseudoalteromonas phenolica]ALO42417.1 peptidoglycan-associated outer membrane lipoprotein [Pseudoalteromonas phenolica]MBE0356486.1 peptidoglycan-associated lipoprotein [Pseudoalteromonas phenolica O-BC30]RXE93816.1 peptidoglycan-associated lipoprotein Pal [Pseudoalteromonas phenolica O-BC30]TMO53403.1 peptidoglycan-associated lipoprotein Pal [Pseudoalteromonas phenolica]
MQLNKTLKALLVALPVMTLAACSSSSNVDESAANQTNAANASQSGSNVEVNTLTPEQAAAEKLQQKYEALRQEQIVYFDFDKSSIRGQYAELLQAHADFLVKNPSVKVLVEGHADERGTPEYNIALGESRGKSVAKYLQSLGVSDSQISVVSYGEEKPMVKSRTEEAFAKNRRAVLVY